MKSPAAVQMKTQKNLLLLQLANSAVFCVHYLLIGAVSGMALNLVGLTRNAVFFHRNLMGKKDKLTPIIFTVITAIVGIISWEAWYSIFVFSGMVIHAFCMAFSNAQNVRKDLDQVQMDHNVKNVKLVRIQLEKEQDV